MNIVEPINIQVDGHETLNVVANLKDGFRVVVIVSYCRKGLKNSFWEIRRD